MKFVIADVEVFSHDWLFIGKDRETGEYTIIHNDASLMKEYIKANEDTIFVFFNGKHYDQFIIKAICCGADNALVKEINDFIIAGGRGWEHPFIRDNYFWFNTTDIKDDVQLGLSLKAIEGHLYLSVEESNIPFDIDRPLTADEMAETVHYCKHDVDATEKLLEVRNDYVQTKINLGMRAGIAPEKALYMTNAKLTAAMLQAERREWDDGRNYVYPPNLDISVIPQNILDFFQTIHDESVPDDVLFKTSLDTEIGGMQCRYAWGGVHGSLHTYHEEATETRAIQNRDVSSLYPSLIEGYNYLSRNVPDPQLFYSIRRERIEAKHKGDKQTAKDLKLPLNTVSGAQENRFNDLYDPLPTRSLRISGQLFLTMLAVQLLNACKTIKLLNFNTDGLMYSIDRDEIHIADEVSAAWEKTTGFELETDDIAKVWIKDVNNLIEVFTDGDYKPVGGYLSYGISVKGAWSINNSAVIVKKALIEYFTKGTPPADTINGCDDIFQFQLIAKAGNKYKEAYHLVDGEPQSVQKVNRVYATTDTRYGRLYKVKEENDATAKIDSLPEHCIIDNDNHLTIAAVDKSFYVNMALKRINDFLGIKPEKEKKARKTKMAATAKKEEALESSSVQNVWQKLLKARVKFLESDVKKTGKNMKLEYKYFELDDIIPVATLIFQSVGLLPLVTFTAEMATMTIVDVDKPDSTIVFTSPMKEIEAAISSRTGGEITNAIQRLGSVETYQRRYLYQVALDICEADSIEPTTGANEAPRVNAPVKAETRQEIKQTLTAPDGKASDLQVRQLKNALSKLRQKDPSKEEMIQNIAIQTGGFTNVSKSDCEQLIIKISEMIAAVKA